MTLIKRYSNRKLYDTKNARYITLREIGDRIRAGEFFRVVDNHVPNTDLTIRTLAQVLLWIQDHGTPTLGAEQLHSLIRNPRATDVSRARTVDAMNVDNLDRAE